MKRLFIIVVLVLLTALAAFAQVKPTKLKINGIGLDSTYAPVVTTLGRPAKDGKPKFQECIGGHEKTVEYAGLSLYFADTRDGKTFQLASFSVTSPKWVVSGVRVGDSQSVVKAKFGTKYRVDHLYRAGSISWGYDDADVTTTVIFKNGKVVEIDSGYMMC